ncbi:hypothetical protein MUK42_09534 [Musa troglodytarum]|uniref:Uncharacterized protein n=1 Tax=Musa troglodytarum TaxID=320322 RepID=A0A9E7FQI8_9LILI|nr:hypothetical protein MUK42_09534 [Musa troglodytarum]
MVFSDRPLLLPRHGDRLGRWTIARCLVLREIPHGCARRCWKGLPHLECLTHQEKDMIVKVEATLWMSYGNRKPSLAKFTVSRIIPSVLADGFEG